VTKVDTINCAICGAQVHYIAKHLQDAHPEVTIEDYQSEHPEAPLASKAFEAARESKLKEKQMQAELAAKILPFVPKDSVEKRPMYELFGLELTEETRLTPRRGQTQGDPVMTDVLVGIDDENEDLVPLIDEDHVWRVSELRDILMGIALNIPMLVWGPHGSGKTTTVEQVNARLNRPTVRIQHTETTEEAHVLGQMVVRNQQTEFELGPLPLAMLNGWTYLADEYDFAHPGVLAVYQPVLEGKPLYIKEAPPSMRLIKPHPHFRFIATGNTNGSGDDTGLYSGTKIGNAANYSRFGLTIRVDYPDDGTEISMLRNRIGLDEDLAGKMVDFAGRIRALHEKGDISIPISPRELIRASLMGAASGGKFRHALDLAYINRLDKIQGQSAREVAQRLFG